MNNEFAFIYVLFVLVALCIAAIAIIHVREKKTRLYTEQPDFFEKFYQKKKTMLEINLPVLSFTMYVILLTVTPIVMGILFWLLFPNKTFAVFMGACCVLLPDFVIRILVETRRKRFEEKYVRALKSLASSLKSGMSIQQAVRDTADNPFISDDIKEGFRQIGADIKVGISVEEAFSIYAEKVDNNDARDVAAAIAMQAEVGGSEAAVIETIAKNIDDRMMTKKRIRAIFSGTDFMVTAFDVFPFLVVIIIYVLMPSYMEPIFNNPLLLTAYMGVLALSVIGSFIIRKRLRRAKGE